MKQDNSNKIWANGLTTEQTIDKFNNLYRCIKLRHLRKYGCKHKVNIMYLLYDGKITVDDLD